MADFDSWLAADGGAKEAPKSAEPFDFDSFISKSQTRPMRQSGLRMVQEGTLPTKDKTYDPSVPVSSYLWNETKKVPGGLLGLAPDVLGWLYEKYAGEPTDFGKHTRRFQEATGVDLPGERTGEDDRLPILFQVGGMILIGVVWISQIKQPPR